MSEGLTVKSGVFELWAGFRVGLDQHSTTELCRGQSFGRKLPLTYFTDHSPVILEWRSGVSRFAPLVMSLTFSHLSRFSDTVIVAKADHEVIKSPIAHSLYLRNVNKEGLSGLLTQSFSREKNP